MDLSPLQKQRYSYSPKLPPAIAGDIAAIQIEKGEPTEALADQAELKNIFAKTYGQPIVVFKKGSNPDISKPRNVGVILSGGQAPGGHNVITGIYDALKKANAKSNLLGFLGGPSGLVDDQAIVFDDAIIDAYRNTGGFDIIGSGRTKIETDKQFASVLETAGRRKLDAVIVIGGDDSNTNAALLAEFFAQKNSPVQVIGVPKTIDGDLKNEYIEASFGFDTATKTYAELIGNIERDANSAKKYWHFIKVMGRSASHIALECALQTQPNIALISEEIEKDGTSLGKLVDGIADVVAARAENKDNFGVIIIPEGLIEFIPEMKKLIQELNDLLADKQDEFSALQNFAAQAEFVQARLSAASSALFKSLPAGIAGQLMADRDPHGNVQVSLIETEKLLMEMTAENLEQRKAAGSYKGKFAGLTHFFGYEGRCAFPSNFDADYCYSLGYTAYLLITSGLSGYLSSVRGISKPASQWISGGIPLTMMMNIEKRHGADKPVIRKALVELEGAPFKFFESKRATWAKTTSFRYPGAIQYYGPAEVCDQPTITLSLEQA